MKESVMSLLEGEMVNNINISSDFDSIEELTESQIGLLGFTPEKIIIMKESGGPYIVEFQNNLERYMVENNTSFKEAISILESTYNIDKRSICVALRESDLGKLDVGALKEEYNFAKIPE